MSAISSRAKSSAVKAMWSAAVAGIVWLAAVIFARIRWEWVSIARAPLPNISRLPMSNIWRHNAQVDLETAAIFDPFGNAVHTALSFPVLGEDVLITGAGPIGIMAAAVVRHAGARHVVITDLNPSGSNSPRRWA